MIYETDFEAKKNSSGEYQTIRHYIIDSDADASKLPTNAPVGSDAFSGTSVYVKFTEGWRAI